MADDLHDLAGRLREGQFRLPSVRDCHAAADIVERHAALLAAIARHRDEVECCRECSDAVAEDRSTADGRLWAVLAAVGERKPERCPTCDAAYVRVMPPPFDCPNPWHTARPVTGEDPA